MEAFLEQFKDVLTKIPMEEIIKATNNFHKDNFIGGGGFGKVYNGIYSPASKRENTDSAFLRDLDRQNGQGKLSLLSRRSHDAFPFTGHEYLISLMGFLQGEGGCYDTSARDLRYLHDPNGTSQRLIHRDIKSANILLDDKWNAKIADFGLSKIGPANQKYSFLFENPAGTFGYCDPLYITHKIHIERVDGNGCGTNGTGPPYAFSAREKPIQQRGLRTGPTTTSHHTAAVEARPQEDP
ncbi:kinase-like domain, phloem protein 2-like protein [Tanacetum coccineum]